MKAISSVPLLSVLVATGLLIPTWSFAQTNQSGIAPSLPSASAASYYYISKPGELTMQVNVWGSVHNPGRYEVPTSTDLVQLLSYAGGPNPDAKLDEVKITSAAMSDQTEPREQVKVNLEELGHVGASKLVLHPGDTIYIDHTTSWETVRDVMSIVSTAALITTAVANVILVERGLR